MSHTPGPWLLQLGGTKAAITTATDNDIIELKPTSAEGRAYWISNARLIAAAPDLLAACEEALRVLTTGRFGFRPLCADDWNCLTRKLSNALRRYPQQP